MAIVEAHIRPIDNGFMLKFCYSIEYQRWAERYYPTAEELGDAVARLFAPIKGDKKE